MDKNKVRFGLKNVHYAPLSIADNGTFTFGTPVPIPGAVNMSVSKSGETAEFYADDGVYFELGDNGGYDGDLEIALIPDAFRVYAMGETMDDNGVLTEQSVPTLGHFALLFEFTGDKNAVRHVLYNCTATQNDVAGKTREKNIEVQTETLHLSARGLPNGGPVKTKTGESTDSGVYEGWYGSVYLSSDAAAAAKLSALSVGATLTPAFDPSITSYTATLSAASSAVSATAASGASAAITVNGSAHTSGQDATWSTGTNTVVVTATKAGLRSTSYTITVTKTAS